MKALAGLLAAWLLCVAAPAAAQGCDRQCLKGLADSYIAAMVAHDPKRAPLAPDVVIVENLARIAPGEGLWKTASAVPGDFRIYVPDVSAQQIGFIGVMQEGGKPIEIGLRLKVAGGRIVEAEHIVVHELREPNLQNLKKPRAAFLQPVPGPYRDSRGRLLWIAASYYDALDENNGALAPFADDCARRENGFQTARYPFLDDPGSEWLGLFGTMGCAAQLDSQVMSYISSIDNRRVWIADEETGLAFGLSHFRHAMEKQEMTILGVPGVTTWKAAYKPFDLPAAHIFKIWGGKLHQIEALGYITAYQSRTGWEK